MSNPSVFFSYSHDSQAHKAWVRKLAESAGITNPQPPTLNPHTAGPSRRTGFFVP
jgi:hypothetical protein